MKKNYLLGIGLLLAGSTFAQNVQSQYPRVVAKGLSSDLTKTYPAEVTSKAFGDSIWGSNFTNVADWTIDNNGQTDTLRGWNINAVTESWAGLPRINSVSGGNYAELVNGNPQATPPTQALNVIYTLSTTAEITIPHSNVSLQFLQHGARFNDAQEMYISINNGTSWIKVGDNSNFDPLTDQGGAAYPNPNKKVINLSSFIPAGTTAIKVRFHWTTGIPAQATNPNVWITYGWGIDDVKISENLEHDLVLEKTVWGVGGDLIPYYKTPISQIQPVNVGGIVANNGSVTSTDAKFSTTVASASFTGTSAATSLAPGVRDTLFIDPAYTPASTVGTYTFNGFNVNSAAHPETDANNSLSSSVALEITNHIYARDNGIKDGTFRDVDKEGYDYGNWFQIFEPISTMGVDVFINSTTSTGALVYAVIRDIDRTIIAQSQQYTIKATDKNKFITLKFDEFTDLEESLYLVSVGTNGGVGTNDLVVGTAGFAPDQLTLIHYAADDENTYFFTNKAAMVRLNFDQTLGLDKVENSVVEFGKLYPNPTSGAATVNYTLKNNADVTVSVVDVTGKVVYTANQGSQVSGSHELTINADAFSAGVYHVTVIANDMKVTQMLVKK